MPAEVWKGAPVAEALSENLKTRIAALAEKDVVPCLGMIRIGERPGDLSYERSATKRCDSLGIALEKHVLPAGVTEDELICLIKRMNADRAIQNSMGLNNPGIDVVAKRVDSQFGAARKRELAVGLSIAETPGLQDEEERLDDVIYSFRKAYNVAEYVEINLSCPNTGHQRIDAQLKYLDRVLQSVMHIRSSIPVRKAVYAKLSPDLGERQLQALLELVTQHNINGLVLFNTFPGSRSEFLEMRTQPDALKPVRQDGDLGGLSGRPLYVNTFRAVEYIKNKLPDKSIIAVGGIDHGAKVFDLLRMGADAVQMYSALSYRWFAARRMQAELYECLAKSGCSTLTELLDGDAL